MGLVLVWATPVVVAVNIFRWMVDFEFGVLNWTLTELHIGDFLNKDWFADLTTGFAVITAIIVWGAILFVAITLYAGLSQVPEELVEAARSTAPAAGASSGHHVPAAAADLRDPHQPLDHLGLPGLQPGLARPRRRAGGGLLADERLLVRRGVQALGEYGFGAAIAVVMVGFMFLATCTSAR